MNKLRQITLGIHRQLLLRPELMMRAKRKTLNKLTFKFKVHPDSVCSIKSVINLAGGP